MSTWDTYLDYKLGTLRGEMPMRLVRNQSPDSSPPPANTQADDFRSQAPKAFHRDLRSRGELSP